MSNKEIAYAFDELANLMELHEEDDFRVRSYRNAYLNLRKIDTPLADMSDAQIKAVKGVGPAIAAKIHELLLGGKMNALEKYRAQTPAGVIEMLDVNGFGPKKVRTVWREMGIESIGELWYACNENRLVEFKGFGLKTQEDLKSKLEYFLKSRHKLHYNAAEEEADFAVSRLGALFPGARIAAVGELRRRCPVVERIELLLGTAPVADGVFQEPVFRELGRAQDRIELEMESGTPFTLHLCGTGDFESRMFELSGPPEFVSAFVQQFPAADEQLTGSEQAVFEKAGLPFIEPELRDLPGIVARAAAGNLPKLIEESDLKGILHVHTTWSDGLHDLRNMCVYARQLGYEYIGITDHSQSAFYANGLKPDRVLAQMEEIDRLNEELAPFRIFKGIESDILNDGSLDYEDALLEKFDFIIASVHSNLKMSREKATERVLRAVENPFTTILGHPTGRLLLSREGYTLDWECIFEACARCGVSIELNANPYRLDLDWTLIPQAVQAGIPISINPDAHSRDGYDHIRYGVLAARKGGLSAAETLNARNLEDFTAYLKKGGR